MQEQNEQAGCVIKRHRQPVGGPGCGWAGQEANHHLTGPIWRSVAGRQPLARWGNPPAHRLADSTGSVWVAHSLHVRIAGAHTLELVAGSAAEWRFKREFDPATGFCRAADPQGRLPATD